MDQKGGKYSHTAGLKYWRKLSHRQQYDLQSSTLATLNVSYLERTVMKGWFPKGKAGEDQFSQANIGH